MPEKEGYIASWNDSGKPFMIPEKKIPQRLDHGELVKPPNKLEFTRNLEVGTVMDFGPDFGYFEVVVPDDEVRKQYEKNDTGIMRLFLKSIDYNRFAAQAKDYKIEKRFLPITDDSKTLLRIPINISSGT